jgi:hypothetical protein
MIDNSVFYVPIPLVCSGQIVEYKQTGNYYYVKISDTYTTMGAVACQLIHQPGAKFNYKIGDRVKVLLWVSYGGVEMKVQNVMHNAKHYIIGLYDKAKMFPLEYGQPWCQNEKDYSYLNRTDDAGLIATDEGMVILNTRGAIKTILRPFGYGIYENMKQDIYQNYHRIISHNDPYQSKEYFGLYKGKDQNEKVGKTDPKSSYLCYKRFITQTMDPSSWVSTCEGTWNPWVGANNNVEEIIKSNNILYTKIIHSGSTSTAKRLTIEAGQEGSTFYNFRIDKMITGEKTVPVGGGASPAVLGSTFKCSISDQGEVDVRAASQGISLANFSGVQLKIDTKGNLIINAKGSITISHGDMDKSTCSIEFDGKGGININALGGFKVNGKPVVSSTFTDFWIQNAVTMYTCAAPGSPAVINPAVPIDAAIKGSIPLTTDASVGGFLTSGLPVAPPITGLQPYDDYHQTTS